MTVVKQKLEDSPEFQVWCFSLLQGGQQALETLEGPGTKIALKETLGNPGNVIDLLENFEINPQIIARKI